MIGFRWMEKCLIKFPVATTLGYLIIASVCLWQLYLSWWAAIIVALSTTVTWWCIYGSAIRRLRHDLGSTNDATQLGERGRVHSAGSETVFGNGRVQEHERPREG